jgi:hypothetical protein
MADNAGFFRDYGIVPTDLRPPDGVVRSVMPWWHVLVQYTFTGFVLLFGLGTAAGLALLLPAGVGVPAAALAFTGTIGLIYVVCRHDIAWVELDAETIRAKHLYTRWVWERSVGEIADLLTITYPFGSVEAGLIEAALGRFRGVQVRFRDGRRPLCIYRADPGMRQARQLIEAILYRMTERGPVDVELTDRGGHPMVRRIFWKADAAG